MGEIKDKVRKIIKPTNKDKFLKTVQELRKTIPKKYNQIELMDYLADPAIDILSSITTRGDGKSENWLQGLGYLSVKLGFQTLIVVRHAELRNAMIAQIQDSYSDSVLLDESLLTFNINMDVTTINYDEYTPFIIVDLNNANDLKNYAGVLRHCNIQLYDEFLAVGGEYTNAEFIKWKTIFETMDRGYVEGMKYTNDRRKAVFLGNPVDWGSEFLAYWDMYHMLEQQPMNTIQKHGMIALERRKNKNAQEHKNNRMFREDESVTGDFSYNSWSVKKPKTSLLPIIIKTRDNFIYLYRDDKPIITVKPYADSYQFNTDIADNREDSYFLTPRFYKDYFYKKYNNDLLWFENQFSKDYILNNFVQLDMFKIIGLADALDQQNEITNLNKPDQDMKAFEQAQLDSLKAKLVREYLI